MPNPLRWIWNAAKRLYRRATGGRSVTNAAVLAIRNGYTATREAIIGRAVEGLATGDNTIQQWILNFRRDLKTAYIQQYVAARGGIQAMTQADWGSLGGQLRNQYRYMNSFAREIANGNLSPEQIRYRMRLYFESSTQAFERGKASARGLVLPQYPGDGRTRCRTNCKCEWSILETDDAWECTWKLNPAEHCLDCLTNAATWNPLVIAKV